MKKLKMHPLRMHIEQAAKTVIIISKNHDHVNGESQMNLPPLLRITLKIPAAAAVVSAAALLSVTASAQQAAYSVSETEYLSDTHADIFSVSEITDDIFERINGKTYSEGCPVPKEDLRYLKFLYKDLDGESHEGEMIVNYHIAEDVLEIMNTLYDSDYPFEKIRLADEYNADDEASMEDNNTSAFNYRLITGTSKISKHALGLAVDINPLYNPYIKYTDSGALLEPVTGGPYLDRAADFPYKIGENDLCYQLFTGYGFEWGGNWYSCKDYQHFETPDSVIHEWYPWY